MLKICPRCSPPSTSSPRLRTTKPSHSRWSKPWPSGCAVVATRVGGMAEIVEDGVTGLLVDRGSAHSLTRRLVAAAGGQNPARKDRRRRAG